MMPAGLVAVATAMHWRLGVQQMGWRMPLGDRGLERESSQAFSRPSRRRTPSAAAKTGGWPF